MWHTQENINKESKKRDTSDILKAFGGSTASVWIRVLDCDQKRCDGNETPDSRS